MVTVPADTVVSCTWCQWSVPLIPWTICHWIGYRIFDRPEIVHIDTYRSPSRQRIRSYRYVSEADDRSVHDNILRNQ